MKKYFLVKFVLFTVLSTFIVFTSCKDYDEEIQQLQNDSASKTALEAAVTELNSLKTQIGAFATDSEVTVAVNTAKTEAINAAISEANKVLNENKGDYDGTLEDLAGLITVLNGNVGVLGDLVDEAELKITANKAAIDLQQAILDKYLLVAGDDNVVDAIKALKSELESIEADFANQSERINALSEQIDAINVSLNVLNFSAINRMITEISFSYEGDSGSGNRYIYFKTAPAKLSHIFGENLTGSIEFIKDKRVVDNEATIEVKVSPVNADLSKTLNQIYLIRRDGNNEINTFIKAVKAERSVALRAAPAVTGLWNITFSMPASSDMKDIVELVGDEEGDYLFAIAIENNVDKENSVRYVVSDFGLRINAEIAESIYNSSEESNLDFSVGTGKSFTSHKDIRNRYLISENGTSTPADKRWAGLGWTDEEETENDANDNRSSANKSFYAVETGKIFNIKLDEPDNVFAYYVVLDKEWAVENAPYELNSWLEYSYTGINKVYKAEEVAEISIKSTVAIGDIIGFRVVAVNFDGTLVDPDGKAFYVTVGAQSASWNDINTVVTAMNPNEVEPIATKSALVDVSLTKLSAAASYEWSTDEADNEDLAVPAYKLYFVGENDEILFSVVNSDGTIASNVDFSKVKYIYTMPIVNDWLAYKDNKVYNGVLIIRNNSGNMLTSMNVSFKKVLPSVAPEGFIEKTGQLTNGLYNGYLIPAKSSDGGATWIEMWNASTGATHGMMMLDQLFNFGTGKLSNFVTTFADSAKKDDEVAPAVVKGAGPLAVSSEYIDNKTSHVSTVKYNYGKISTTTPDKDYSVVVKEFRTIYSNIYNNTFSWNWASREQLKLNEEDVMPYKTEVVYGAGTTDGDVTYPSATVNLAHIFGVSERDSRYSAPLSVPYLGSLVFDVDNPVKLITTSGGLVEYFDASLSGNIITLIGKSGATNPIIDVHSTLVITAKDMYGNKFDIKLPMTVKKR